jgi:hypothetical protein
MMPQLLAHLFGDYIFQSDYMAQNKTKRSWPAFVHALLYSLCFVWLCWLPGYVIVHNPPCVTYLDKYGSESACVSEGMHVPSNPTSYNVYAVSGDVGAGSKIVKGYFRWLPWLVIFGTHFLIDRFRLARYVVWVKNWLGPWSRMETVGEAAMRMKAAGELSNPIAMPGELRGIKTRRINLMAPLSACPTGYPPSTPIWMATFLLIVADNSIHLLVNYLALRYL